MNSSRRPKSEQPGRGAALGADSGLPLESAASRPGVFPLRTPSSNPPGIRGLHSRPYWGVSPAAPVLPQRVIFSFSTPQQPRSPKKPSASSRGGRATGRGLRSGGGGLSRTSHVGSVPPEDTIEADLGQRSCSCSRRTGPPPLTNPRGAWWCELTQGSESGIGGPSFRGVSPSPTLAQPEDAEAPGRFQRRQTGTFVLVCV